MSQRRRVFLYHNETVGDLMEYLTRFPGIGSRAAERIVEYLIQMSAEDVEHFVQTLSAVKKQLRCCAQCFYYAQEKWCDICRNPSRQTESLCVVENPKDVWFIERSGQHKGYYHVLLGHISYVDGKLPDHLTIQNLLDRMKKYPFKEIILATHPTLEGEGTALYISQKIRDQLPSVKITRLARGVPFGVPFEYTSTASLADAFQGRVPFSGG